MGSHCVGRVNRLKGASRSFGSPDLGGLASSGVKTPSERLPTLLRRYRYANTTTHWLPDEI
ncbi:MAG: hypothetical protein HWQ23_26925 [Nostoc sp. JL33]|uniref:hypothetical protein n=1 Tax=Nostoc sp. JL33 TaxID=2815396 RepID=UPI0025D3F25D|nr:hypothetical protein [Nostoc sp. JL33]MBN3873768.1 hypothetical protein [Nostoc sp. JL33]